MLRKPSAALVAVCCLLAGTASANYTIDLIWSDSGSSHLDILAPGDPTPTTGGTLCHSGALSTAGAGRCLLIQLTATAQFTAAVVTLGWDAAASGLAIDFAPLRSFGLYGGGPPGAGPVSPNPTGTADCVSLSCDTAFGSFGGISNSAIAAGVYTIGSINIDMSGIFGIHPDPIILAFLRSGVDGVTDKKFAPAPVQLNAATLFVAPEPGTASLLGLGVLGLCAIARRRNELDITR